MRLRGQVFELKSAGRGGLALEQRDIDQAGRLASIRRSFTKGQLKLPTSEASVRAVPLQARAFAALQRLPADSDSPACLSALSEAATSTPAPLSPSATGDQQLAA